MVNANFIDKDLISSIVIDFLLTLLTSKCQSLLIGSKVAIYN
jgi:hypothetical protein